MYQKSLDRYLPTPEDYYKLISMIQIPITWPLKIVKPQKQRVVQKIVYQC
jgi:hypothetical protein